MWERAGAKDAASEFEGRGLWKGWRRREFEKRGSSGWRSEGGFENCAWVRFAYSEDELGYIGTEVTAYKFRVVLEDSVAGGWA